MAETRQKLEAGNASGFGGKPVSRPPMRASNWRPLERGTLRGFFDLRLPSGLTIRECTYHEKGDSRWVGLPGRPQIDAGGRQRIDPATGKKAYVAVVELARERREAFQLQALTAIDGMLVEESR